MPVTLSYLQAHLEELAQSGLHVVSAMPNWLVTVATLFYGAGGPAVPPRSSPKLDLPAAGNAPVGWRVSFVDPGLPFDPRSAEDVVVAVLDTAHNPDRLMSAAARLEFRRNWLLKRLAEDLRNENGLLEIEYDRFPVSNDMRTGHDADSQPRYYFMPDHGIFVAGLIRDVAPNARIRLIRILNDFAGGDLYKLFAALTHLEQELHSGTILDPVLHDSLNIQPARHPLPYVG